jgi:hypothetical protein
MLSLTSKGGAVMKTISIFLALVNSLLAGVLLLISLTGNEVHQAEFLWLLTKSLAAVGIIIIGIFTWLGAMRTLNPGLMAVGSLFLIVLGTATTVWTFHLVLVTGDMEYYMVVYGGSLMMQGMASLFGLGDESRNMTVS